MAFVRNFSTAYKGIKYQYPRGKGTFASYLITFSFCGIVFEKTCLIERDLGNVVHYKASLSKWVSFGYYPDLRNGQVILFLDKKKLKIVCFMSTRPTLDIRLEDVEIIVVHYETSPFHQGFLRKKFLN